MSLCDFCISTIQQMNSIGTLHLYIDNPDSRDVNEVSRDDDNDSVEDCHTFQLHIMHHELPNKLLIRYPFPCDMTTTTCLAIQFYYCGGSE